MGDSTTIGRVGARALLATLAASASLGVMSVAAAQTAQPTPAPATNTGPGSNQVSEVVVTGSLIRGTPEDAALPVQVIGTDELLKQGTPNTVDLIKNLAVSNGVLGDTNQFDARAQGSEGSGSVNLRGLGPQRTLVLINGRRTAINPFGQGGAGVVDTNMIPVAAIGRVEVLKDGAAATYGSDAIAGVVNFITRDRFDGLEVAGDYKYVDGSDGDYSLSALWGWRGDRADVLLSAGYQHRSELRTLDRDFIKNLTYAQNPGFSFSAAGGPGTYLSFTAPAAAGAQLSRDAGCANLGGTPGNAGTTPVCYEKFVDYDNLVEEENHYQIYGQVNFELNEHNKFHGEALYGRTEVPRYHTTPTYALLASPTAETLAGAPGLLGGAVPVSALYANRYYVPPTNPGLQAYVASYPQFANFLTFGAAVLAPAARPILLAGNPALRDADDNPLGASLGKRYYSDYRVSGGFNGDLPFWGMHYDTNLSYSQETAFRQGYDSLADRFELALRGLGGPLCNIAANTPGQNNCLYFNPFSSGIAANAVTGQTNPNFNQAVSVANNPDLVRWFFRSTETKQRDNLFVADAVASGELGWLTLPGGTVKYGFGSQYRQEHFITQYDDLSNAAVTPCVNTPDFGVTNCTGAVRNGPFVFLGQGREADLEQDVYAFFGELQIPVFSNFNIQVAARYEDYGGAVGDTFNPKVSAKWQITPWLGLRASAGSTFRGPPVTQLAPGTVTALSSIAGTYRAIDIAGNPNLRPETADTYNVGLLFQRWGFRASLDYFDFELKDSINAEPSALLVSAVFPTGQADRCNNPAFAALVQRFTFVGACSVANISRVFTQYANGSKVSTSGLDLAGSWRHELLGGDVVLGGQGTYVTDYSVGATTIAGVQLDTGFNAVGKLNYLLVAPPIPRYKGSIYANYTRGPHDARITVNYINGYTDQRTDIFAAAANGLGTGPVLAGKEIDSFVTVDLSYRLQLPWQTTLTLAIDNLLDEDPPFARLDLGYDPFTANAYGRQIKFGVRKKF